MPTTRVSAATIVRYEVTDELDLQDTSTSHRRVISPCQVVLHIEPGTRQVLYAAIDGWQVRLDGTLSKRRHTQQIIVSLDEHDAAAPPWLNQLMQDENLEWAPGRRLGRPAAEVTIAPPALPRLNQPMLVRLRECAADTSSNWKRSFTMHPPESRGLVELIDLMYHPSDVRQ